MCLALDGRQHGAGQKVKNHCFALPCIASQLLLAGKVAFPHRDSFILPFSSPNSLPATSCRPSLKDVTFLCGRNCLLARRHTAHQSHHPQDQEEALRCSLEGSNRGTSSPPVLWVIPVVWMACLKSDIIPQTWEMSPGTKGHKDLLL